MQNFSLRFSSWSSRMEFDFVAVVVVFDRIVYSKSNSIVEKQIKVIDCMEVGGLQNEDKIMCGLKTNSLNGAFRYVVPFDPSDA